MSNMENLFCSYIISRKMKELGFKVPCMGVHEQVIQDGEIRFRLNYQYEGAFCNHNYGDNDEIIICSAPLIGQCIQWLINEHKLYPLISIGGDDTIHPKWMIDGINDISDPNSEIKLALSNLEVAYEDIIFYDSYTEAKSAAILMTLNKIGELKK